MSVEIVTIYGASDDLVEIEGNIEGADEYNSDDWEGIIVAPNGETARLYVKYQRSGCWTVALGRYEEGYKLPFWNNRTVAAPDCDYSAAMILEVPEGTIITACES